MRGDIPGATNEHGLIATPSSSTAVTLLNARSLPSANDKSLIQDSIRVANDRLLILEENIARVQLELNHLFAERETIRKEKALNLYALAPIRRCPPEIISQIFLHCVPDAYASVAIPVILSHVCSLWRIIAIEATPKLWSSILIAYDSSKFCVHVHPAAVDAWIQRSGTTPLSFTLLDHQTYDFGVTQKSGLKSALSTIYRWEQAYLGLYNDEEHNHQLTIAISAIPPHKPPHVPLLKFLAIRTLPDPTNTWNFYAFRWAERLQSLQISGMIVGLQVPWSRLTRLEVDCVEASGYLSLLPLMADLATLIIVDCAMFSDSVEGVVKHTGLRNLLIKPLNEYVAELFGWLELPNLRKLWFDGLSPSSDPEDDDAVLAWTDIHHPLLSFLTRSSCRLHTFSAVNVCIPSALCLELLHMVPTVIDLRLGQNFPPESWDAQHHTLAMLFTHLTISAEDSTTTCPALESLTVYSHGLHDRNDALIELVNSRLHSRTSGQSGMRMAVALQKLSLRVGSPLEIRFFAQLQELEAKSESVLGLLEVITGEPDENTSVFPPGDWDNPIENDY